MLHVRPISSRSVSSPEYKFDRQELKEFIVKVSVIFRADLCKYLPYNIHYDDDNTIQNWGYNQTV
jgi:hypothetical protein